MADSNTKQVQTFMNRLKHHQDRYQELLEELKDCENMINLNKKMIYDICEHDWEIDYTLSDEHTEYVCKKCNMIRS